MKEDQLIISLDLATLENMVNEAKIVKAKAPSDFSGIVSLKLVGLPSGLIGEEDHVVCTLEKKGFGVKPEFVATNLPD